MKPREMASGTRTNILPDISGLSFLWALNDHCDRAVLLDQLRAFQRAGVRSLVLHPRAGLLCPYGGDDWFELIRWLARQCLQHGIEPILYDEDPYPSGNAGGRIVAENPELIGFDIQQFIAPSSLKEGGLFVFPTGRLCWAGVISSGIATVDLSDRVGMIRRHWEKSEWNSRWYYPATPIYSHSRAFALHAEYALRCPALPKNGRLMAFVARPVEGESEWGWTADALNPATVRCFLERTHEQYRRIFGHDFGHTVRAIFTDEPKPHSIHPWTPGMFSCFQECYGYDLKTRLHALFFSGDDPRGMKVRLDYREWVGRRFEEVWMKPVSDWCRIHGVALIGHTSPEEDPINQAQTIGCLFPLQRHLSLSGFDIIIHAIGDNKHPLLNVAAILSTSTAQQNRQAGVCCESLGACGNVSERHIARVLAWQALHGVNLAVLHAAFVSQLGLRRHEAPPDYGPNSVYWKALTSMRERLEPFFVSTIEAVQEAPVAILWPIHSFQALGLPWHPENDCELRKDLLEVLSICLGLQIGVHLINEGSLSQTKLKNGHLCIGRARYSCVVIPSVRIMTEAACKALQIAAQSGVKVIGVGKTADWIRGQDCELRRARSKLWPTEALTKFRTRTAPFLPRVAEMQGMNPSDIHATIWRKGGREEMFLMNVSEGLNGVTVNGRNFDFSAGELMRFRRRKGEWQLLERFSPEAYRSAIPAPSKVRFGRWSMHLPNGCIKRSPQPLAVYQLIPCNGPQTIPTIVTRGFNVGGGVIAEKLVYEVQVTLPSQKFEAVLWIEPTLMRGSFTLKVARRQWQFQVKDTDVSPQKIKLPPPGKGRRLKLTFVLHKPDAADGIKAIPKIA